MNISDIIKITEFEIEEIEIEGKKYCIPTTIEFEDKFGSRSIKGIDALGKILSRRKTTKLKTVLKGMKEKESSDAIKTNIEKVQNTIGEMNYDGFEGLVENIKKEKAKKGVLLIKIEILDKYLTSGSLTDDDTAIITYDDGTKDELKGDALKQFLDRKIPDKSLLTKPVNYVVTESTSDKKRYTEFKRVYLQEGIVAFKNENVYDYLERNKGEHSSVKEMLDKEKYIVAYSDRGKDFVDSGMKNLPEGTKIVIVRKKDDLSIVKATIIYPNDSRFFGDVDDEHDEEFEIVIQDEETIKQILYQLTGENDFNKQVQVAKGKGITIVNKQRIINIQVSERTKKIARGIAIGALAGLVLVGSYYLSHRTKGKDTHDVVSNPTGYTETTVEMNSYTPTPAVNDGVEFQSENDRYYALVQGMERIGYEASSPKSYEEQVESIIGRQEGVYDAPAVYVSTSWEFDGYDEVVLSYFDTYHNDLVEKSRSGSNDEETMKCIRSFYEDICKFVFGSIEINGNRYSYANLSDKAKIVVDHHVVSVLIAVKYAHPNFSNEFLAKYPIDYVASWINTELNNLNARTR